MFSAKKTKSFWITAWLAITAGLIYNSWPLGYLLNPKVSRNGLASELEALHQPYGWLFISMDVVSGALVTIVAYRLWRHSRGSIYKVALINFAIFGVLTAIGALLPMTCEPSLTSCPSWRDNPVLIMHGITSIVSSVSLFVSVVLVWYLLRHKKGTGVMSVLIAGWTIFGAISFYAFFEPGPGNLSQHYYITLCSVWIALAPFMFPKEYDKTVKKLSGRRRKRV